ncbi:ThuA domain-containing protein [Aquincola sp. MAHUQ-54]|uniref:ThuA domain-containing protein n=1 Tax=Aquincola agrisoli TaxID=3119538 RepID=A0AAW9Q6X5_9BURK
MVNLVKLSGAVAGVAMMGLSSGAMAQAGNGPKGFFDPIYNVCRGLDPACYSDWGRVRQNKVLIYSRTAGPRHANLGPALPAGLNPTLDPTRNIAQHHLKRLLNDEGIEVDWTEDVTRLNSLNNYKAVIFLSTSRDTMTDHAKTAAGGTQVDAAKTSLRKYIQGGGGFVAIHNAFGTEYNWPWYEGLLGNANFYDHGANQNGDIVFVNKTDVSTAGLPTRVGFKDEWYTLVPFPTNVRFLATVDTETLAVKRATGGHPGHGKFHPVSWCQYYDGGKSWVTTLGHDSNAFLPADQINTAQFKVEGAMAFQKHVVNGIKSVMGLVPFCK